MNREVEFLFDYGSPFSYLGNLQIEGSAKRNGAEVRPPRRCYTG
jgi:2-hydroxychromene-2-carboxylate isomerase